MIDDLDFNEKIKAFKKLEWPKGCTRPTPQAYCDLHMHLGSRDAVIDNLAELYMHDFITEAFGVTDQDHYDVWEVLYKAFPMEYDNKMCHIDRVIREELKDFLESSSF